MDFKVGPVKLETGVQARRASCNWGVWAGWSALPQNGLKRGSAMQDSTRNGSKDINVIQSLYINPCNFH